MVRATFDSKFADDFEQRLRERKLVKKLAVLRVVCGLSQEELAEKLGCTQGRISKIEAGKDEDLRLGTLAEYVNALGLRLKVVLEAEHPSTVKLLQGSASQRSTRKAHALPSRPFEILEVNKPDRCSNEIPTSKTTAPKDKSRGRSGKVSAGRVEL